MFIFQTNKLVFSPAATSNVLLDKNKLIGRQSLQTSTLSFFGCYQLSSLFYSLSSSWFSLVSFSGDSFLSDKMEDLAGCSLAVRALFCFALLSVSPEILYSVNVSLESHYDQSKRSPLDTDIDNNNKWQVLMAA